jgi:hypothetical protein
MDEERREADLEPTALLGQHSDPGGHDGFPGSFFFDATIFTGA